MNTRRATALLGGISLLSVIARLFQLQGLHPIVWDEIEFFRATDWVRRGLVPYRDFWEHHTPLQWFVFAPVTALTNSPGVSAILLMRWAQLPLWIVAFVLLRGWMRRAGVSVFGAWTAMALVLCSTLFMLPAVEYRQDVLGSVIYISAIDPGGIAIIIIGAIAIVRALRSFRTPGDDFFLAFVQVANLLFIAAMKFIFNYHLEIVVLLMAPLIAIEIDRFTTSESRRRAIIALVIIAAAINIAAAVFRGKESDTVYEDFVMREIDRRTPPASKVFDSVGWALLRDPAYRYWFMRENVFVM